MLVTVNSMFISDQGFRIRPALASIPVSESRRVAVGCLGVGCGVTQTPATSLLIEADQFVSYRRRSITMSSPLAAVSPTAVLLSNTGATTLHINTTLMSGPYAADYSIQHSCTTLNPGTSCAIKYRVHT